MKSNRSLVAIVLASVTILLASHTVQAQLEEIVVTATKRTESLQDIPMALTALSGVDLENMGAEELLDFAVKVPNLGMAYEADGRFDSSSPSIRGVFGVGTTGFYIDDTQVTATLLPRVVDLERIEVLRGPQGSLYGARSMGGTIRLITKQPYLNETEGALKVALSSVKDGDENYNFDFSYNFPVIEDVFALRISGYYGENSGVQDRVHQDTTDDFTNGGTRPTNTPVFATNENVDDEDYYGGTITGNWVISDTLRFVPKYMFQSVSSDGLPFADITPDNTTQLRFFDSEEPGTDDWSVLSGTVFWDAFNGSITSTTSYYQRETDEFEEEHHFLNFLYDAVIGLPIDPLESTLSTFEDYESFTHETRYTTEFDGNWQFTVGVYYQDLSLFHNYPPALQVGANAALNIAAGGPADIVPGDLIFTTITQTDTEEIAVFGEVTWDVTDRFTVTAGGRWYDTSVHAVNTSDGFANSGPSSFDNRQSESGFNPKVVAEFAATDDINVYASAAKGFRIGGVNGNVPIGLCGPELTMLGLNPSNATTFDSDSLWSYELGLKSTLADGRVTMNAAGYFIDWSDIQQLNRLACGFQFTQNAGAGESKGFEIEISAAPTDNLAINFGIGYTDAEITDAGGIPGVTNGDKIQGVPDLTLNGSAEYRFNLSSTWEGVLRVDANHYGDSFSANNESSSADQRLREAWEAVNLRATASSDRYSITVFADNVTDERANLADSRSIAAETPGRQRLVTNRPRTIGIEGRIRF